MAKLICKPRSYQEGLSWKGFHLGCSSKVEEFNEFDATLQPKYQKNSLKMDANIYVQRLGEVFRRQKMLIKAKEVRGIGFCHFS